MRVHPRALIVPAVLCLAFATASCGQGSSDGQDQGAAASPTASAESHSESSTADDHSGDDATETSPESDDGSANTDVSDAVRIDVRIRGGQVTPSGERVEATVGQKIRLRVSSDMADEIHVHSTPEHEFEVKPTSGQTFTFSVGRPGVIEVESHETGAVIVSLAVTP